MSKGAATSGKTGHEGKKSQNTNHLSLMSSSEPFCSSNSILSLDPSVGEEMRSSLSTTTPSSAASIPTLWVASFLFFTLFFPPPGPATSPTPQSSMAPLPSFALSLCGLPPIRALGTGGGPSMVVEGGSGSTGGSTAIRLTLRLRLRLRVPSADPRTPKSSGQSGRLLRPVSAVKRVRRLGPSCSSESLLSRAWLLAADTPPVLAR